uniref:Uncharacterized protein n=1 Tax=Anguilla anguilla TaxID=7936 RepID=A0A0E9UWK1_ANGAN
MIKQHKQSHIDILLMSWGNSHESI